MVAKKVLVLEDDQAFVDQLTGQGLPSAVSIKTAQSLLELGSFAELQNYQLIVVRERLAAVRAIEVAQYVEAFFPSIPVIVITNSQLKEQTEEPQYPPCVTAIVEKSLGARAVIRTVLDVLSGVKSAKNQTVDPSQVFELAIESTVES
jgi:CheY-like chemotaxis protein